MPGARIVFSGYLVRYAIGGYFWQVAHYLIGLRALGHDVWFYEDNGGWEPAYDAVTGGYDADYAYGLARVAAFLRELDLGERWVFADVRRGLEHGPAAGSAERLLREADLVVNFGGVNPIQGRCRDGRAVYIDSDPVLTQLRLAESAGGAGGLAGHAALFTFGENIGTGRSPTPTHGVPWRPTRQPVVLDLWAGGDPAGCAFTTVGTWDTPDRDVTYRDETFRWRKRTEWLRFLALPALTGSRLELAMGVPAADRERLRTDGWRVVDPLAVSADPWRYRDYLRGSRGEFTVAKDLNVRFRSGWFSDRGACYLAAGRPVVMQDTGFGDVLPLGPGLHAFRTVQEAAEAIKAIEADWPRASRHAAEVARECFAADKVLAGLLAGAGL